MTGKAKSIAGQNVAVVPAADSQVDAKGLPENAEQAHSPQPQNALATSLCLRPVSFATAFVAKDRDAALWALVRDGRGSAQGLMLTYLLRRDGAFEVKLDTTSGAVAGSIDDGHAGI